MGTTPPTPLTDVQMAAALGQKVGELNALMMQAAAQGVAIVYDKVPYARFPQSEVLTAHVDKVLS